MIQPDIAFLDVDRPPDRHAATRSGARPTLVFLPGYASDMTGPKATAIDAFAARRGLACLRLDYSGHGLERR